MADPNLEATSESSWFSPFVGSGNNIVENLEQIRNYAYNVFDKLDQNHDGFIEQEELLKYRTEQKLTGQERAFVDFLLTNAQQIADAFDENDEKHREGISRNDIESYFDLIKTLL